MALLLSITSALAQAPKQKHSFTIDVPLQSRDSSLRSFNGISYVSPGVLAVWYTQKTGEGRLSKRDKLDAGDPWQLKLQLIKTGDGSVQRQFAWPTRKNSSAFIVQSGRPVLLTGPLIQCFSGDFKDAKSFTVKNAAKPKEIRVLRSSPGGRYAWLVEASDSATATRIDPESCGSGWSLNEPRTVPSLSGNDNLLVDSNPKQVGVYSPTQGWKLLYRHECCLSHTRFVAQDLIAAIQLDLDIRRHFLLLDTKGQLLLDDTLEHGYEFQDIYPSADGKTAAVIVTERDLNSIPTGIEIRKTTAKIRLYDLGTHKRMANLEATIPGEHLFGMAIAPDSSEFALLNGSKLTIYDLRR